MEKTSRLLMDDLFPGLTQEEDLTTDTEHLQQAREKYAELVDAAEKIPESHLACVLTEHGLHVWENVADRPEGLRDMISGLVAFAFEEIAGQETLEAAALWLMEMVTACGSG